MLDADDIARLTAERALESAHRQMFGIIVCFVLLSPLGPMGAVLYRLASILGRKWGSIAGSAGQFGEFAARAYPLDQLDSGTADRAELCRGG